jgi:F-type H+-transporting ATPase subunit delta
MTLKAIARQYANAAFDVVRRTDQVDEFGRQLQAFADLVAQNDELRRALDSVAVPRQTKRELVLALLDNAGSVMPELRRLLEMMADNDRLPLVASVAEAFRLRALDAAGVIQAELVSAQPLDENRQAALARALGQATGRRVDVTGRVDESIIGGVIAKVGSTIYDGSVSRQLERMRQRLTTDR